MTTADSRHVRHGRAGETWHRFRRWRQARPFWGGLFTALAGVEIFATTQMSLDGLSFQLGPTGFLSWLIPTILATCGMLMWFSPQQRIFYAVVATVTALFSLIGVNLGGFFIGLLLGLLGGALSFAWMPGSAPLAPVEPVGEPADAAPDDQPPGMSTDTEVDARPPGEHGTRLFGALLPLVVVTVSVALAAPPPVRAAASPTLGAVEAPRDCLTHPPSTAPSPSTRPSPDGSQPGSTGEPSSDAAGDERGRGTDIIGDILDGIGRLFGRDDDEDSGDEGGGEVGPPSGESATPEPGPTAGPPTSPDQSCGTPRTGGDGEPDEAGEALPRIAVEPGQPLVAATTSKLTGSKVTMHALRFEGIVDLPTAEGTLRTLKFRMDRAVTDDFLLRSPGPSGRTLRYATERLTVRGDVSFYATRFSGRLLGIRITLTPDLPLPDGIPITSPVPITFTDPVMDLAFVTSDTLTARPRLRVDLG